MSSPITQYYVTQAGGGHFYAGSSYQKGYGIGSWLGGLFRSVLPILRSGAIAVGREAARAGSHVLADVATGENVRESVRKHAGEVATNLTGQMKRKLESMEGSGAIKRRKISTPHHSAPKAQRGKTSKRAHDIYS